MKRAFLFLFALVYLPAQLAAAEPDWPSVERHATELLQAYVRIPSINPPADTRATAALLQKELQAAGIESKLYESGPNHVNLYARLPGRKRDLKPLLLLNHMDVVPVDAKRWNVDPFGAAIRDGLLWGRGSLDMKSTGIMELTAFVLLKKLGIVPPRDIVFLATCDEETNGTYGARWMIEHHWDELNPEYVLDEGGVGSRDLFSPNKTVFGISVGDKQVLWVRLRAEGTSGHASQPIPDNANDILLRAIEKAGELSPPKNPNATVEAMRSSLHTLADNKFINATQKNTVSLTTLRSGVGDPPKVNVIPSVAEATIDCRLLPGVNADEFLSEIKARINNPKVTVTRISEPVDAGPSSTQTPLYKAVRASVQKVHSEATVVPVIVPYGTDGQKFRKRGVPAYGLMPMIIDTATLATMHSDSEHIPVQQFIDGLHIYFNILTAEY